MHIRLVIILVALFLGVSYGETKAASLYMEPNSVEIQLGDTIAVSVRLDTDEDECVNTIDGVITYSPNIEPVDTSRGNSIMSLWIQDPTIDKQKRTISFAGGIPNGYCGRIPGDPRLSNVIVELLFRSPGMVIGAVSDSDLALIDFSPETRVLLNDGFGTDAQLTTYGAEINLLKTVSNRLTNEWSDRVGADNLPPEKFSIYLERTPNAFSNKYYIVFNTTDKQSGIDHYEVIEESLEESNFFNWGAADAPWVKARSPYVLKDQSLNSTIRVRAIDKAGNEYIATLIPDESQRSLSTEGKIMIALVLTAVTVFFTTALIVWFWVQRRKRREENNVDKNSSVDDE